MTKLKNISLIVLTLFSAACGNGTQSINTGGQPVFPGAGGIPGGCMARLDQPIQFVIQGALMNAVRIEAGRIGPQNRISPNVVRGAVQIGAGAPQQSPWTKVAYQNSALTLSVLLQDPNAYMAMAMGMPPNLPTIQTSLQGSVVLGPVLLQTIAQIYGGQLPCVMAMGVFANHTPMAIVGQQQPVDIVTPGGQGLIYLYLNVDPNNPMELIF